jgi:N-methylhydantoinase A
MLLGIDTGGTFTDFFLLADHRVRVHKVLSTPDAPERAILQGISELGLSLAGLQIVHGSTVATNAVLEGKGVRTAYVTNSGLGDVLTIGRQARRELYSLQPEPVEPPVPPELCFEVDARLAADGSVVTALADTDLDELLARLKAAAPEAVAINMLFSFVDDEQEQRIEQLLPDDWFISCSSAVLPEYREYERGMTTWLNASVGPLVQGYLERLTTAVEPASVTVMQSDGGTIAAQQAGRHAVHMLLSGPAGGLTGARYAAGLSAHRRLMTFDMGGTSSDVALIEDEIELTSEGHIAGYPVGVPMVDMHTIGAGGGSIASIDAGGLLRVGPESAGADPGPACYGQGGTEPTVTDANLVLGRLQPDAFLGGRMRLDIEAARKVVSALGRQLGKDSYETARGIIRVANEHMVQALRVISVQRGHDPRDFTLVSFGGAGGLHVCELAAALGMRSALVPVHGGVLSALGMLAAPRTRRLSRSLVRLLSNANTGLLERVFGQLREQGQAELLSEGVALQDICCRLAVDLRYQGQSYALTVPWENPDLAEQTFHECHRQRYGHALEEPVELVTLRVVLAGPEPDISLSAASGARRAEPRMVRLPGTETAVPLYERDNLFLEQTVTGPALITEEVATTWVEHGWQCRSDRAGNLIMTWIKENET